MGIKLDEPMGDCEGDGFFQCDRKCGIFVNIRQVEVGDFPELGLDTSSTDEL